MAWGRQSAQADFVSSLRRIHSLGWDSAHSFPAPEMRAGRIIVRQVSSVQYRRVRVG
jgi:hypothetical protein